MFDVSLWTLCAGAALTDVRDGLLPVEHDVVKVGVVLGAAVSPHTHNLQLVRGSTRLLGLHQRVHVFTRVAPPAGKTDNACSVPFTSLLLTLLRCLFVCLLVF